jgi:hypothetical protein
MQLSFQLLGIVLPAAAADAAQPFAQLLMLSVFATAAAVVLKCICRAAVSPSRSLLALPALYTHSYTEQPWDVTR